MTKQSKKVLCYFCNKGFRFWETKATYNDNIYHVSCLRQWAKLEVTRLVERAVRIIFDIVFDKEE